MSTAERTLRGRPAPIISGVLAGPFFVSGFTAIGATRGGYNWQRDPVSSLAIGRRGWLQRANFVLGGVLYSYAARGLGRWPGRSIGPRVVPALVAGVGIGLVGSGVFVTGPVEGFPPGALDEQTSHDTDAARTARTREGRLHNICAIPIFAGIPIAGLASTATAVRSRDYRWASFSAGSSLIMTGTFLLFGKAFGRSPSRLTGKGGIFERISIASGFGWLTALLLRTLSIAETHDPIGTEQP